MTTMDAPTVAAWSKRQRRQRASSTSTNVSRSLMRPYTIVFSLLAVTASQLPLVHCFVHPRTTQRISSIQIGRRLPQNPLYFPSSSSTSTTSLGYDDDKSPDTSSDHGVRINDEAAHKRKAFMEFKCPLSSNSNSNSNASSNSIKDSQEPNQLVNIRYRGTWYDVTKWRRAHSAGSHWLDWFDKRDATEIIDGLHSTHSRQMTTRLPKAKPEVAAQLESQAAPDSKVQIAFRKLFDKLLEEGWWKRDMRFEVKQLGIWASLFLGAVATAKSIPNLSFILLGLSFVGGGWLGHDYIHGLDKFSKSMRMMLPLTTGLSTRWWSDKHNKHHALTNEIGVDEDMATDPILYTWAPDPSQDSMFRRIQHHIFLLPFTFLFALWRMDSITAALHAIRLKRPDAKKELYSILIHYTLILTLFPLKVFVPAVLLSGVISAVVVTSTHQSEEKFTEFVSDHVTRQFLCTRSVVMTNPISAWIWGGMQYQIEHHLFPSMPRSRLPALKKIIQKFAKENNIKGGYRESGELEILRMNWETYRAAAKAEPVEGAPTTRGREGQQAAIAEGFTAVHPFHNKKP